VPEAKAVFDKIKGEEKAYGGRYDFNFH